MVFARQKARAGGNPKSPERTQLGTNIHEVSTPRRTAFTREQNELFVQQVLQFSQEDKGCEFHYHVLGFNYSSTEYDMEKAYRSLALQFHPDKNQHSQVSDVMKIINEVKE